MSNAEELYDSASQNVLSRLGQEATQQQRYKEGTMEAQARIIGATGQETIAKAQEGMAGIGTGSALGVGIGAIRTLYKNKLTSQAKTLMKKKLQERMKKNRGNNNDGEDDDSNVSDTNSTTNLDKTDNSTPTQDPANPTQTDTTPSGSGDTPITKKTGENFGDEDDLDVEPTDQVSSLTDDPTSSVGQQTIQRPPDTANDPATQNTRPQLQGDDDPIQPAPPEPAVPEPATPAPATPKPTTEDLNVTDDLNTQLDSAGNMTSKLTNLMKGQGFSDDMIGSITSKLNAGDSSDITDTLTEGFSSLLEEGGTSMLGTALDFLGPLGALAGVGLGIYGAVEGDDEDDSALKNAKTYQSDLTFLGSSPQLQTGSIAMPTMDTTQLRTGGMMNF